MSALPAGVYGIRDKGLLREGYDADINVFALENLASAATYSEPKRFPTGFDYVLVNGQIAVDHDRLSRRPCGRLLRR